MPRCLRVLVVVPLFVLASCSGGGGDALTNALAADLLAESDSSEAESLGVEVDQELADCAAGNIVDRVGADRLEELGVTPENTAMDAANFTDEENGLVAAAFFDCMNDDEFSSMIAEAGDLDAETVTCLVDSLGRDSLTEAMLGVGGPTEEFGAAMTDCGAI